MCIRDRMDGVPVQLIDKSWSAQDFLEIAGRGGAGAMILAVFFPAGFTLGAIIGALSKILSMETGYYDKNKYMVRAGKIYEDDLF